MANRLQHLRGSEAEHSTFTGAKGEISLVTDTSSDRIPTGEVRVHDGTTAGGLPLTLGTTSKPLTNNIVLGSGVGINFNNYGSEDSNSATTVGSNLLDDYEEGTFQVSIDAGYTTNPGLGTNIGNYIKIGNVVHCHIRLDLDGTGSGGSADVEIGGLPFTTLSSNTTRNTNFNGNFSAFNTNSLTENAYYYASTLYNDNSFRIYHFTSGSIDGLTGSELGTNAIIIVTLTYFIAPFA